MTSSDTTSAPQLTAPYDSSDFDPLRPTDLLHDEVRQRRETGFDVDDVVRRANLTDPTDRDAVLALVDEMAELEREPGWEFEEPDGLDRIAAALPTVPEPSRVRPDLLADQIHAAWAGRIAGCIMGKPVERGEHWTVERIRDYLERAGAYPLRDYVPLLDPMPAEFQLRESWPETTAGRVDGAARDDDIDYTILALHLLEQHGQDLRPEHVGQAWTSLLPLGRVYTAERAAYVNLANGLRPPEVARCRNPYREWIGAQIRGDAFGYVHPGDPWGAAAHAYQDASLSHVGNGVYGEMWAAALTAAAFTAPTARDAVVTALAVVPPRSRLAAALRHVLTLEADGVSWDEALHLIRSAYGQYSWVHTINNAAVVAAALLWGEDDYTSAVGNAVMSGWDTDSNGATTGSVAGILAGTSGLPDRLIAPLYDRARSALFGFDNSRISELAARTHRLATSGHVGASGHVAASGREPVS